MTPQSWVQWRLRQPRPRRVLIDGRVGGDRGGVCFRTQPQTTWPACELLLAPPLLSWAPCASRQHIRTKEVPRGERCGAWSSRLNGTYTRASYFTLQWVGACAPVEYVGMPPPPAPSSLFNICSSTSRTTSITLRRTGEFVAGSRAASTPPTHTPSRHPHHCLCVRLSKSIQGPVSQKSFARSQHQSESVLESHCLQQALPIKGQGSPVLEVCSTRQQQCTNDGYTHKSSCRGASTAGPGSARM